MRGVRKTDPWTSWAASWEDGDDMRLRSVVLGALGWFGPMTHDQLIEAVTQIRHASPSGVRSRCKELVADGLVEQVPDMVAKSKYGRVSLLWQVVR